MKAMAERLAASARRMGKVLAIAPISARDRRQIHLALVGVEGVSTHSEGEGLFRQLLIVPSKERRRRGGVVAKPKTRDERLFSAAVLRRSFELQDAQYREGFQFVYQGVLRDLGLDRRRGGGVPRRAPRRGRGRHRPRGAAVAGPRDGPRPSTRRSRAGSRRSSLAVTGAARQLLERYADRLLVWNRKVNLTAITDAGRGGREAPRRQPGAAPLRRRRADAARRRAAAPACPGIPLACARPDLAVTCCDSVAKKIAFVKAVSAELEPRRPRRGRARRGPAGARAASRAPTRWSPARSPIPSAGSRSALTTSPRAGRSFAMLGREVDRAAARVHRRRARARARRPRPVRAPDLPLRPRGGPLAAAVNPAPPPPAPFASSEGARRTARSRAPAFPPRLPPAPRTTAKGGEHVSRRTGAQRALGKRLIHGPP